MSVHNPIEEVKEAIRCVKDRRHFECYQAVYLYLSGYKMKEIAHIIGRIPEIMGIYISTYKESGLEGLALGHSTGQPSKLSKEQKAILLETVSTQFPAMWVLQPDTTGRLRLLLNSLEEKGISPILWAECPAS